MNSTVKCEQCKLFNFKTTRINDYPSVSCVKDATKLWITVIGLEMSCLTTICKSPRRPQSNHLQGGGWD